LAEILILFHTKKFFDIKPARTSLRTEFVSL